MYWIEADDGKSIYILTPDGGNLSLFCSNLNKARQKGRNFHFTMDGKCLCVMKSRNLKLIEIKEDFTKGREGKISMLDFNNCIESYNQDHIILGKNGENLLIFKIWFSEEKVESIETHRCVIYSFDIRRRNGRVWNIVVHPNKPFIFLTLVNYEAYTLRNSNLVILEMKNEKLEIVFESDVFDWNVKKFNNFELLGIFKGILYFFGMNQERLLRVFRFDEEEKKLVEMKELKKVVKTGEGETLQRVEGNIFMGACRDNEVLRIEVI